jgi:hypothetical protein
MMHARYRCSGLLPLEEYDRLSARPSYRSTACTSVNPHPWIVSTSHSGIKALIVLTEKHGLQGFFSRECHSQTASMA